MKKGILLPIFSLPSRYGIGDFGYEAFEFIDILKENCIDYWEILPINESGRYPYSPISYYALNRNYISLDKLKDMKLIDKLEQRENSSRAIYDDFKDKYYKEAFSKFKPNDEFIKFSLNTKIDEYAQYMTNKYKEDKKYYIFLQYILDKQWNELKNYANLNGVKIIGDMPIYPDFDSCEVTYYSKYYELNNGKMEYVSGASPDYFNSEGQKWGHPLYNFKSIEKDSFKYLIERYLEFLHRYDIVRIDHFRAFDSYYKIPIKKSAKEGFYVEGPGEKFFDELFKYTNSNRFIVEDLGDIRKETELLRDKYNFTRMKILQYSLNLEKICDEYDDTENMVIYPGNHDNNTIIGWYNSLSQIKKKNLIRFLKNNDCYDEKVNVAIIKYCLKSMAKIMIVSVQDIIGLDESSRINLPGHEYEDNWAFKLTDFNALKSNINVLK